MILEPHSPGPASKAAIEWPSLTSAPKPHAGPPGRAEQRSTRIGFFIAGFGLAAWAPLVIFAKARTGLDDGGLGVMLLCLGGGSIVVMPLAGALAAQIGCRRVLVAGSLLICLTLPLLASLTKAPLLGAALLFFGAGIGSVDCVINMQGVIVERASGRPMMSGFHGLFSLGGIIGAATVSGLLSLGASPLDAALCAAACVVVALVAAVRHFLPYGGEGVGPAFAVPRGMVLLIGLLCFVVFLAEGAMVDWGAVFLTTVRGVDPAHAGLGYAAFAATMTIGRLKGDAFVRRIGTVKITVWGGLCAASGMLLAVLVPAWPASLFGFAMVGVGCSNIVPVLYTAVARQSTMPEHLAIPAITTLGYAGVLAGPAGIGFVAHLASLSVAFFIVAILLAGVAGCGPLLRSKRDGADRPGFAGGPSS